MEENGKKGSFLGKILVPPALIICGLVGLWENENRFDYAHAARQSRAINSIDEAKFADAISFSGSQDSTIAVFDDYMQPFFGFNKVRRDSEIYSWRSTTSKGTTKWSLGWHSHVDNNSRNQGLVKGLSSSDLYPKEYRIKDFVIYPGSIHLTDSEQVIESKLVVMGRKGSELGLKMENGYFYKRVSPDSPSKEPVLGDERISYRGIPIAPVSSYFGKLAPEDGVATGKQFKFKASFISRFIGNDGILHHIVSGDRSAALANIEAYFTKIKWMIRGAGTVMIILGFFIIGSSLVQFLLSWPIIGNLASTGVFILSVIIGGSLSLITISAGMLYAHPQTALGLASAVVGMLWLLGSGKNKTKKNVRAQLEESRPAEPMATGKRIEATFYNMVKLAHYDGKADDAEKKYLVAWAKRHGLSDDQVKSMYFEAKKEDRDKITATSWQDLVFLIRLAMADGFLSFKEVNFLCAFGRKMGMDSKSVKELVEQVRLGKVKEPVLPAYQAKAS